MTVNGCPWCGGPRLIIYTTPHGHAEWCPTYNPESTLTSQPDPEPGVEIDDQEMWRLYGLGLSYAQIGRILQVSRKLVRHRITTEER